MDGPVRVRDPELPRKAFLRPTDQTSKHPGIERTEVDWRDDVKLLVEEHRKLREVVAAVDERILSRKPKGSRFTFEALIRGAAAHDLYHAGQIQLLKRLIRER